MVWKLDVRVLIVDAIRPGLQIFDDMTPALSQNEEPSGRVTSPRSHTVRL
jgi:hypothetical protein